MTTHIIAFTLAFILCTSAAAQANSFRLERNGQPQFPIGCYELPQDDARLQEMADAGINLMRCHNPADLDRIQAVGMKAVFSLPLQHGATDKLKATIKAVAGHPAIALWEGPDEVVWNFTAASTLHRRLGVHKQPRAWWRQDPDAIAYAQEKAAEILPNMRQAVEAIHALEPHPHPVWINEAIRSDLLYVRQCLDFIDITGCDIYPVSERERNIADIGPTTQRWLQVGRGIPVFMVLQAFSWNELGDYHGHTETVYPTFAESRFMAYDAIAHGASGILYWGSHYLKSEPFRQSIYALTSELAALQPLLTGQTIADASLQVIETEGAPRVAMLARRTGDDWLIVLINEDDEDHMGVVVNGLHDAEGRTLHQLYTPDTATIRHGELITRLMAHQVQVFTTDPRFQSPRTTGRDFAQ